MTSLTIITQFVYLLQCLLARGVSQKLGEFWFGTKRCPNFIPTLT